MPSSRFASPVSVTAALLIVALSWLVVPVPAVQAQDLLEALRSEPGFVDLESLDVGLNSERQVVDIHLTGPLIKMIGEATREEDPEFADLVAGLQLVRVNIFNLEGEDETDVDIERLDRRTRAMLGVLQEEGWLPVVQVRDDGDHIYVAIKMRGDRIAGLTALFRDTTQLGLVNIVGDLDPVQIGRIGQRLGLDPLQQLGESMHEGDAAGASDGGASDGGASDGGASDAESAPAAPEESEP